MRGVRTEKAFLQVALNSLEFCSITEVNAYSWHWKECCVPSPTGVTWCAYMWKQLLSHGLFWKISVWFNTVLWCIRFHFINSGIWTSAVTKVAEGYFFWFSFVKYTGVFIFLVLYNMHSCIEMEIKLKYVIINSNLHIIYPRYLCKNCSLTWLLQSHIHYAGTVCVCRHLKMEWNKKRNLIIISKPHNILV